MSWKIIEVNVRINQNAIRCIFKAVNDIALKVVNTNIEHLPSELKEEARKIEEMILDRLKDFNISVAIGSTNGSSNQEKEGRKDG